MATITARAEPRVSAAALPRAEIVERALGQFRPEVSNRVRSFAARHPWIADLAVSFPALLFALAYPRKRSLEAERLAITGASLPKLAQAAGVPLWLRAFPAKAFLGPIPALPDGADFRRRIANHLPRRWSEAPRWLETVSLGATWGDNDIAIWLAREAPAAPRRRRYARRAPRDQRRLVTLWAWFSVRPDTRAGALAATRWNADMKWPAAAAAAFDWSDALTGHLYLDDEPIADTWVEPGEMDGYTFTPLTTARALIEESNAMNNCVRGYGQNVADNYYRLWSVRKNGERVATLSLSVAFPDAPYPHIYELSAPGNQPAASEVWLAARRWLHAQDKPGADPARLKSRISSEKSAVWRALWRPYWLAKRRIPDWLPLTPRPLYEI